MSPAVPESTRAQAVQDLFDSLLRFSRSLRSRSGAWNRGLGDLSRGDLVTLGVVERHGSVRPGQIAALLGVDPSVVSRQLTALERLALVARQGDPSDRRAEQITITDTGRERLLHNRAAMCEVLGDRVNDWDLEEIAGAARVVEELAALLSDTPDNDETTTENHQEVQGAHV